MVEKPKEAEPACRRDEENSGIHAAFGVAEPIAVTGPRAVPLLVGPSAESDGDHAAASERWGVWGEELARGLTAEPGARVLRRFPRLTRDDGAAVLESAAARLVRSGPPSPGPIDAHVRRTVYCEAIETARLRFIEELRVDAAEATRRIERARRRLASLTPREASVLRAVFTLDAVAEEDEVGKVVLHAAVAYQMRWNTAHQHVSRAWRKLGDGGLAEWEIDWRAAHRFIAGPPSFPLWTAAREYLDACSGRGVHGGPAFAEWTAAHEHHNTCFNEWKKCSQAGGHSFRAFVERLDRGRIKPVDIAAELLDRCEDLGLDRWLESTKLAQLTWRRLVGDAHRPSPGARRAWRELVTAHPFGAEIEVALFEMENETTRAEASGAAVADAYQRLLTAAELRSAEGVRARDEFRCLLEAARWT